MNGIIPVLILTFNRPEFLRDRLKEVIARDKHPYVVVSIDFDSEEMIQKNMGVIAEFKAQSTHLECIVREYNLGIAKHLPTAVTEVLDNHEFVIVIEDDIKIGCNALRTLAGSREIFNQNGNVFTLGGFTWTTWVAHGIRQNKWRNTRYFSAWGWMTSRQQWSNYQQDLRKENIENLFETYNPTSGLNTMQKRLWIKRFEKCQNMPSRTWDIPMQYWTFKSNKVHLLPTQRIVENVGFNNKLSTNTKSKRPKWMSTERISHRQISKKVSIGFINSTYQFIDSLTIADDQPLKHKLKRLLKDGDN